MPIVRSASSPARARATVVNGSVGLQEVLLLGRVHRFDPCTDNFWVMVCLRLYGYRSPEPHHNVRSAAWIDRIAGKRLWRTFKVPDRLESQTPVTLQNVHPVRRR